ncbi:PssE/Cps14G family polysaccharide biosynthesis glycosyltransferase [Anaerosporobacter sp.]
MIFVILGTQKFQLNRLLKTLDMYIEQNLIEEEVIAQIGNSDYTPVHYTYERFLDKEKFDAYIKGASLVITHSGVGSIITSINAKKPIIVYPRLAKYKEHVDDHQLDIASAFEKKNYVLCCNEKDQLIDLIHKGKDCEFEIYTSKREQIIDIVSQFLATN